MNDGANSDLSPARSRFGVVFVRLRPHIIGLTKTANFTE